MLFFLIKSVSVEKRIFTTQVLTKTLWCSSFVKAIAVQLYFKILTILNSIRWLKKFTGQIWLGVSDKETEGLWKYTNGKVADDLMYSWCEHEPDNSEGNEHCSWKFTPWHSNSWDDMTFTGDPCLKDHNCDSQKHYAVCQKPNGECYYNT